MKYNLCLVILAAFVLSIISCSPKTPPPPVSTTVVTPLNEPQITLILGGYGYQVGDIVTAPKRTPKAGDIVQYDANKNQSNCMTFGPGFYLAKIIGVSGDGVSFQKWSYNSNGNEVILDRYYQANGKTTVYWPKTLDVMWGNDILGDADGKDLKIPAGEFLADKWIGYQCTGEMVNGSSKTYNRFTVKQEALVGVITSKIGHDSVFEEKQKNIVY